MARSVWYLAVPLCSDSPLWYCFPIRVSAFLGVISDGSLYGAPAGVYYSMPVICKGTLIYLCKCIRIYIYMHIGALPGLTRLDARHLHRYAPLHIHIDRLRRA